jgi:putative Holliday junction resolvase
MAVGVDTFDRAHALDELAQLAFQNAVLEVVVGLPISLAGRETSSTTDAREFAGELANALHCPVRMIDERLSTVEASASLRQAGRSSKQQRGVVDQVAAVILLQHALDAERIQGVPPGLLIESPLPHD